MASRWSIITHSRVATSLAIVALFGFALAAQAEATVLFSNLATPDSFNAALSFGVGNPMPDVDWAATFTTPDRDFQLDAIDVAVSLTSGPDDTLEVWLMTDAGGSPGAIIEVMTITGVAAAPSVRTATSAANPVLDANTQFWVALSVPGTAVIGWHLNDTGDFGTMVNRSDGGMWTSFPALRAAFRVDATVVPEPFKDAPRVTAGGGTFAFSTNYTYVATTGIALGTPPLDALTGTPSSANYTMASGYWHRAESPVLPDADMTLDDMADGRDLQGLVDQEIAGVAGDIFLIPHADFNCDGVVDLLDIPPFADRLLRGLPAGPANTVFPLPLSTGININADLAWIAGAGAVSTDVYLGTMEEAVRTATPLDFEFEGNTASTTWEPGILTPLTDYFWRLDSVDQFGRITKGAVWSFSTGP